MWSEEQIEEYLKKNLEQKRFKHSISVRDTAIDMGKFYGENIEKLRIAGLVHDCAKNIKGYELINIARKHGYKIDDVCKKSPQLLHGLVGSIIAKEVMEINNKDILNAIAYHTTGRKNMTMIEKIIYLADYIEPLRKYDGVNELRKIAYKDIDKAMIESFNVTIKFVIERGQLIHLNTIEGRNYILKTVGE
ncbi:bis(5'-nucleosyl)-tetraphosphatase (symmetrical) YqeK [Clostridium rectalis]|uniref:bis(5'-nucleosyl)-tetraphosphatase (symmetrical) YqeK n=1 Tax=Clostridium rectalis TaxID=2040295 RepID=UPI000F63FFD9|nr:bis(5'-nucleosyl)-tetraphosphatase (symmetrical) YqeK [Clostridium rectalis]